jgi:zinc transport system substrate-binding protein
MPDDSRPGHVTLPSPLHPASRRAPSRRGLLTGVGLTAAALGLAACGAGGKDDGGSDGPTVIVGCYGLSYIAELVAGDAARVVNLAKPGIDPHDLELSVAEVAELEKADLIVTIPAFQASVDDAISSKGLQDAHLDVSTVVDLLPAAGGHGHDEETEETEEHGANDPHFWNDPTLLATVGDEISARLGKIASDRSDTFTANAKQAHEDLDTLDADLAKAFDEVDGPKPFVTSHTAFAYLAKRYGLEQIGITGIDPEAEPSPKRLLQLRDVIDERDLTTVFFETTASPKVAETLAKNVGVEAEELDNLETQLSPDTDYAAVMRENCKKLVASWT